MAGSAEICNSYAWTKTLLSQRRQTRRTAMLGRTSWLLAGAFALTAALPSGSPLGSHSAFALGAGGAGGAARVRGHLRRVPAPRAAFRPLPNSTLAKFQPTFANANRRPGDGHCDPAYRQVAGDGQRRSLVET